MLVFRKACTRVVWSWTQNCSKPFPVTIHCAVALVKLDEIWPSEKVLELTRSRICCSKNVG
ncbi:MAG: hypothetical protein EBR62_03575 [Verrucomicrobia bacterium]|nr:hypothetical protein [Verrucomicrobiota bacterium]